MDIAYAGKVVQVEATATLSIGSYVYINGTFDFQSGAVANVILSDNPATHKDVSVMTVGASGVDIFVGVNRPADAYGAMGLSITNATFGLALLKPTNTADHSSYFGLSATASSVGFVGVTDSSSNPLLAVNVQGLTIQVNGGTDTSG